MKLNISIFTLFALTLLISCGNNSRATLGKEQDNALLTTKTDYVEVLFFHNHERCSTCTEMEKIIKETVANNFQRQLDDGSLVLRIVDIDDKENRSLTDSYEVVWTSLYINKWEEGVETRNNLTEFAFLYIDSSPDVLKNGIIQEIKELLK